MHPRHVAHVNHARVAKKPKATHPVTGALGQVDGLEQPLETRPLTVAAPARVVGIMQRAAWAVMRRELTALDRITERTLCVVDDETDAQPRHASESSSSIRSDRTGGDSTALPGDSVVTG